MRQKLRGISLSFIWNFDACFYHERMFPLKLRRNLRSACLMKLTPGLQSVQFILGPPPAPLGRKFFQCFLSVQLQLLLASQTLSLSWQWRYIVSWLPRDRFQSKFWGVRTPLTWNFPIFLLSERSRKLIDKLLRNTFSWNLAPWK